MATSKTIITLMLITLVSVIGTGCSDDSSPAAPVAVVVDTAPPAVPANLAYFVGSDALELSWDQNFTDADLAGFIVKRENDGTSVDLLATPQNISSYTDSAVPEGASIYSVYSVDFTGNESAIVSVTYTSARDRVEYDLSN